MLSAVQLSELVERFRSGKLSSEQFVEQYMSLSHNLHKCSDPEAVRLCRAIEGRLASIISGHLSIEDLQPVVALEGLFPRQAVVVVENITVSEKASQVVPFFFSGGYSPEFEPEPVGSPVLLAATA